MSIRQGDNNTWRFYCDKTNHCRMLGTSGPMSQELAQRMSDKHDRLKHS